MNLIRDAKQRLTMSRFWKQLGLPGDAVPGKSIRSPFREDRKASFCIHSSDQGWIDFGTGETGDQIDLVQRRFGYDKRQAIRKFLELAGTSSSFIQPKAPQARPERPNCSFRLGTETEIRRVADLRGLSVEAVQAAQNYGLLRFGAHRDEPAWFVTDKTAVNAQARRLDGENWGSSENGLKAITLSGSKASWPLGTEESKDFEKVAFVEGGPDLLAAFAAIQAEGKYNVAVVAMLGAAHKIPLSALPVFANKRIRIFAHSDEAGQKAGERWSAQLTEFGCDVDAFRFPRLRTFSGNEIKDLNDFLRIHPDDFELMKIKHEVMP
jgi:hypothetical protein